MANIEIPVSLGLKDAQSQINQLRQALQQSVKLDSSAGKSLTSILDSAQKSVDKLTGKMSNAFKSASGSSSFLKDYEKMIELLTAATQKMTNLGVTDIKFSVSDQQAVDSTIQKIQSLQQALESIQDGKAIEVINVSQANGIDNLRQQLAQLKIDASKLSFNEIGEKLASAANQANTEVKDLTNNIQNINSQIGKLNTQGFQDIAKLSDFSTKGVSRILDAGNVDSVNDKLQKLAATMTDITVKPMTATAGQDITAFITSQTQAIEKQYNKQIQTIQSKKDEIASIVNDVAQAGARTSKNGTISYGHWTNEQMQQLMSMPSVENIIKKLKEDTNLNFDSLGIRQQFAKFREALNQELQSLNTQQINLQQLRDNVKTEVTKVFDNVGEAVVGSRSQLQSSIKSLFANLGISGDELKKIFDINSISSGEKMLDIINRIKAGLTSYIATLDKTANTDLAAKLQVAQNAFNDLTNAQNTNKAVSQESNTAAQSLQNQINTLAAQIQVLVDKYNALTGSHITFDVSGIEGAKGQIESYIQSLNKLQQKQQALGNIQMAVNRWMGFWQVLNMTKSAINDMKKHIQELDAVMTSISVVTNFSQEDLWGQISQYSEIARQYGVAIKGVYEVSQIYYQQGLQQNDVMTLTTETLKMARIAGLDYATAADYMTTAIRGFKLEMTDAAHVTDVFSALAATTASSTEEIAVAISKTAASAAAVGASFEATSAMMATMIATTRESATNIGTALKSVISRYGEMTSDPSKTVDSEGEEMSLNRVDKALQTVGITIHDTAGQFRDFDDVMLELMEKWDSLDSLSQRYIATLMAGNRQQSRFLALVSNVDEYKKALQTAMDSEGTGELQTLKTLDSIDAKIEKMKVTIQEFYTSSGLEELYKNVLDTITNIVVAANSLPKTFGKIPAQAIAIGASIISTIKSVLTLFINSISVGLDQIKGKNTSLLQAIVEAWGRAGTESATKYNANQQAILESGQTRHRRMENPNLKAGRGKTSKELSSAGKLISTYAGAAFSLLGSGLTLSSLNEYGASSSSSQDIGAGIKGIFGGLSSITGGALTGLATGGIPGAVLGGIVSGITQIPSIAAAVDMISVSSTRRVELAEKAATEAKTEATKQKAETSNLAKAVDTYKELEAKAYSSAEAMQEFKDHMNTLAESYPNLISRMDESGNYIIELETLEGALAAAREKTAIATANATQAELNAQKETREVWQEAYNSTTNLEDIRTNNYDEWAADMGSWGELWRGYGFSESYEEFGKTAEERILGLYNALVPDEQQLDELGDFFNSEVRNQINQTIMGFKQLDATNIYHTLNDQIENLQKIDSSLSVEELTGFSSLDIIDDSNVNIIKAAQRLNQRAKEYVMRYDNLINNISDVFVSERADVTIQRMAKQDLSKTFDYEKHGKSIQSLISYNKELSELASQDTEESDEFEKAADKKTLEYINYFKTHTQTLKYLEEELNLNEFSSLQSLKAELSKNIAQDDSTTVDSEIESAYIEQWQNERNNIIELYAKQLRQLFDVGEIPKEFFAGNFTNSTILAIQNDLTKYSSMLEHGNFSGAEAYLNNMIAIYGAIKQLDDADQIQLAPLIQDLDLSNPEALHVAAETLEEMGPQFSNLSTILNNAALRWATSAATLIESLGTSAQETAKSIESSIADMSKVFTYSEALEKAQVLIDANKDQDLEFNQLYTFDKEAGGYIKTAKAYNLEMESFKKAQIEGVSQSITDLTQTLAPFAELPDYLVIGDEDLFAEELNIEKDSVDFDRLWQEYQNIVTAFEQQDPNNKKDWTTFFTEYIEKNGEQLKIRLEEIQNMSQEMARQALSTFDYTSIASGKGTAQNKEELKALLMSSARSTKIGDEELSPQEEIDKYFDKFYTDIITGDIKAANAFLKSEGLKDFLISQNKVDRARFESLTSLYDKIASGDVIFDALLPDEQTLLNSVLAEGSKLSEGAGADQVGAAADNVWQAIIALIAAGAGTLNEVADTIANKADKNFKESNAGKQYNLLTSYKDGFTSSEAQELGLLDDNGNLKEDFTQYLERDSAGNWVAKAGQDAASVITELARILGFTIDKTTNEYKNTIKESVDEAIAAADKADIGKQRVNAWQSVMSGKVSDRISLAGVDKTTKSYMKAAGLIADTDAEFVYIESEEQLNNAINWMKNKIADKGWSTSNKQTSRYFNSVIKDFDAKSKKGDALTGIIAESVNQSAAESFALAFEGTTEKASEVMKRIGAVWDDLSQSWIIGPEDLSAIEGYINELEALDVTGANASTIAQMRASVETLRTTFEKRPIQAISDIFNNYNNLSTEMIATFDQYWLDKVDLTKYVISSDEVTGNKTIDKVGLMNALMEAGVYVEDLFNQTLNQTADELLSQLSTGMNLQITGTNSFTEMQNFIKQINDNFDLNIDANTAFNYNTILDSFTLNSDVFYKYREALVNKLKEEYKWSDDLINAYIDDQTNKLLKQNISIDGFLNAKTTEERTREGQKLAQSFRTLIESQGKKISDAQLQSHLQIIMNGGKATVDLLKYYKGEELSADEIEKAYNISIERLRIAYSELGKGVGETVTGIAADIIRTTSGFKYQEIGNGDIVIEAVGDMVSAYADLYGRMQANAQATTADLNNTFAKLLTANDQKNIDITDALQNASGMTYDAFAQILTKYNESLEQVMANPSAWGIESTGFGKIRITNWENFATRVFKTTDFTSLYGNEEYISAYKAYNDGLISMNKAAEAAIADELSSIANIQNGDWINISEFVLAYQKIFSDDSENTIQKLNEDLKVFGAHIEEGILKTLPNMNADVFGIYEILEHAAENIQAEAKGVDYSDQIASIKDSINSLLNNYIESLSSGFNGSLTNTQAISLKQMASHWGLSDYIQYTETADGLQLTTDSALTLYGALSLTNNALSKKLLPDLVKMSSSYNNLQKVMSSYAKITNKAGKETEENTDATTDNTNNKARETAASQTLTEALQAAALQAMYNSMLDNPDTYSIYGKHPMNSNWQSAYNYGQSTKTKVDYIKAASKGQMGMSDFYDAMNVIMDNGENDPEGAQWALGMLRNASKYMTLDKSGNPIINTKDLGLVKQSKKFDSYLTESMESIRGAGEKRQQLFSDLFYGSNALGYADIWETDTNGTRTRKINGEKLSSLLNKKTDEQGQMIYDILSKFKIDKGKNLAEKIKSNKAIDEKTEQPIIEALAGVDWGLDDIESQVQKVLKDAGMGGVIHLDASGNIDHIEIKTDGSKDIKTVFKIGDQEVEGTYESYQEVLLANLQKDASDWSKDESSGNWSMKFTLAGQEIDMTLKFDGTTEYVCTIDGQTVTADSMDGLKIALMALTDYNGEDNTESVDGSGKTHKITIGNEHYEITISGDSSKVTFVDENGKPLNDQGNFKTQLESGLEKFNKQQQEALNLGEISEATVSVKTLNLTIGAETESKLSLENMDENESKFSIEKIMGTVTNFLVNVAKDANISLNQESESNIENNLTPLEKAFVGTKSLIVSMAEGAKSYFKSLQGPVELEDINSAAAKVKQLEIAAEAINLIDVGNVQGLENLLKALQISADNKEIDITVKTNPEINNTVDTLDNINMLLESVISKESLAKMISIMIDINENKPLEDVVKLLSKIPNRFKRTYDIITNYTTYGTPPKQDNGDADANEFGGPWLNNTSTLSKAKGTLMGELGPELVVSNGHYFVVGQNGAEMVDLSDDAIVFNHLQTEQLLKKGVSSGRGRAITNERNAVSYAGGNQPEGLLNDNEPTKNQLKETMKVVKSVNNIIQETADLSQHASQTQIEAAQKQQYAAEEQLRVQKAAEEAQRKINRNINYHSETVSNGLLHPGSTDNKWIHFKPIDYGEIVADKTNSNENSTSASSSNNNSNKSKNNSSGGNALSGTTKQWLSGGYGASGGSGGNGSSKTEDKDKKDGITESEAKSEISNLLNDLLSKGIEYVREIGLEAYENLTPTLKANLGAMIDSGKSYRDFIRAYAGALNASMQEINEKYFEAWQKDLEAGGLSESIMDAAEGLSFYANRKIGGSSSDWTTIFGNYADVAAAAEAGIIKWNADLRQYIIENEQALLDYFGTNTSAIHNWESIKLDNAQSIWDEIDEALENAMKTEGITNKEANKLIAQLKQQGIYVEKSQIFMNNTNGKLVLLSSAFENISKQIEAGIKELNSTSISQQELQQNGLNNISTAYADKIIEVITDISETASKALSSQMTFVEFDELKTRITQAGFETLTQEDYKAVYNGVELTWSGAQKIMGDLIAQGATNEAQTLLEAYNERISEKIAKETKTTSGQLKNVVEELTFINETTIAGTVDQLKEIANVAGLSLEELINSSEWDKQLQKYIINRKDIDIDWSKIEQIQDTIIDGVNEFISTLTDTIKNGIAGTLKNADITSITGMLAQYGFDNINLNFDKTTEGLKLSEQSAIKLYTILKQIDDIHARLVFSDLNESLKKSNDSYETMHTTMARIVELKEKIASAEAKRDNTKVEQYKEELALAKEILAVRATQEDESMNFMDQDIPGALKNPFNYASNITKAMQALREAFQPNNEETAPGFLGYKDFYNIGKWINEQAGVLGKEIEWAGVRLNGSWETFGRLIEKGSQALAVTETGEIKVSLENLGIGLRDGFDQAANLTSEGLQVFAKSQIEVIDGLINFLETIVAMKELENLDNDDNGIIDLPEIFSDTELTKYTEKYQAFGKQMLELAQEGTPLKKAIEDVKINGITIAQILEDAASGQKAVNLSAEELQQALQALRELAESNDWDLNNIGESLGKILAGLNKDKIAITYGDQTVRIINGKVVIEAEKDGQQIYQYDGKEYNDISQIYSEINRKTIEEIQTMNYQSINSDNDTDKINIDFHNLITTTLKLDSTTGQLIDVGTGKSYTTFDDFVEAQRLKYNSQHEGAELSDIEFKAEFRLLPTINNVNDLTADQIKALKDAGINTGRAMQEAWGQTEEEHMQFAIKYGFFFEPDENNDLNIDFTTKLDELLADEKKTIYVTATYSSDSNPTVEKILNSGHTEATVSINADVSSAEQTTSNFISRTNALKAAVVIEARNNIETELNKLESIINRLTDKTITVKVEESPTESRSNASFAKGNFVGTALAGGSKQTLMGELGPELYVSKGHYHVVGQNGAEFVSLPEDAIVFNHLQTAKLLGTGKSGRGVPITNEANAVSMARGNVGPAHASADAALAMLKSLRAAWESLAGMTTAQLAGKASQNSGGEEAKNWIATVERWYDYLQKIARLEKEINKEESLRKTLMSEQVAHGDLYYKSQLATLNEYKEQAKTYQALAQEQENFFEKRRAELNAANSPFSEFYSYDEYGQIKYNEGGLEFLSSLMNTNEQGKPDLSIYQKYRKFYDYKDANGKYSLREYMKYDSSGNRIEGGDYQAAVQAIWERMEAEQEEMQSLYNSKEDAKAKTLDGITKANEILEEMRDNQIELENKVLEAIEAREQALIDKITEERQQLSDASSKYIKGLRDALSKEREMYQQNNENKELIQLQRRLAILQRSGGAQSDILNLQRQVQEKNREAYFDAQEAQIKAFEEASNEQLEKMETQIKIMTETLAFQKEHGLLQMEMNQILQSTSESITAFITENMKDWQSKTALSQEKESREILFSAQQYETMIGNNPSTITTEDYYSVFKPHEVYQHGSSPDIALDLSNSDAAETTLTSEQILKMREELINEYSKNTSLISSIQNKLLKGIDAWNRAVYYNADKGDKIATTNLNQNVQIVIEKLADGYDTNRAVNDVLATLQEYASKNGANTTIRR